MLIYIVRHGETNLNVKGCIQGQVDEPLNQNGRDVAVLTGKGMKDIHFDVVYSSPQIRAYETAEIILRENETAGDVVIHKDDRLKEMNWGSWDTLGCVRWNYEVPCEDFGLWYRDSFKFKGPEDGESALEAIDRLGGFLQEVIHTPEYQDKTILLSTHGAALRAMLHDIYGEENDFWHGGVPKNCAVNILEVKDGEAKLIGDDVLYYDAGLDHENYMDV